MKKLLCLLLVPCTFYHAHAQTTGCYFDPTITGGATIPYNTSLHMAGKITRSPELPFNFTLNMSDPFYVLNGGGITACINSATSAWKKALTSPDPTGTLKVNVNVVFADLGYSSGGYLLAQTAMTPIKDCGNCGITSTLYAQALANFRECLAGHTGNTYPTSGSAYDMTVTLNSNANVPWNFNSSGGCPAHMVDFTTVLTHEIAHGLGFTTSVNLNQNTSYSLTWLDFNRYSLGAYPTIYDQYVTDNGTGHTTACPTWGSTTLDAWWIGGGITPTFTLGGPSLGANEISFQDYCQGQGHYTPSGCDAGTDNLYFKGTASYQLYAPNVWSNPSSIAHIYTTTPGSELMEWSTPAATQLSISAADLDVLSTIGWDISTSVGGSHYITISNATDCSSDPDFVFNLGVANNYCVDYSSCSACNSLYYGVGQWSLGLYDHNGTFHPNIVTQTNGYSWSPVINSSDIPSGVVWDRDINNRVPGVLSFVGTDGTAFIGIALNYAPQNAQLNIKSISDYSCYCDQEELQFFAPGATKYDIYKRIRSSAPGGLWSPTWALVTSSSIPAPACIYDFSIANSNSLSMYNDYEFQVKASDASGNYVMSNIVYRYHCKDIVIVAPNPVSISASSATLNVTVNPSTGSGQDGDNGFPDGSSDAYLGADGVDVSTFTSNFNPCGPLNANPFLLTSATLVNASNPNLTYSYSFDGSANAAQLNISQVMPGIYTLTAYSSGTDESVSTQVEIDN